MITLTTLDLQHRQMKHFKDRELEFTDTAILDPDLGDNVVMHAWEDCIMKRKAEFICQDGGHILEFGFGMGISADYIQSHEIESHTICEIHPQILLRLFKWAEDKPNVIIMAGDWQDNIPSMTKYDGILFDTYQDAGNHQRKFKELLPTICNPSCKVTWWNNAPEATRNNTMGLDGVDYEQMIVNVPSNPYYWGNKYFMPKYIFS